MDNLPQKFQVRVAQDADDLIAAQRLRYDVFVNQLGGDGAAVDHAARREADQYDDHAAHLLVMTETQLVAVCRLLDRSAAAAAGGFYSATEFDLSPLLNSGKSLLEMGRLCIHPDHRGGPVLAQLWSGLADYVQRGGYDLLFGTASFSGSNTQPYSVALSWLHDHHLAAPQICPIAHKPAPFVQIPSPNQRMAAMSLPPLIKAYIRYGGKIGQGVHVDHAFNTVDVCMLLDLATANQAVLRRARGAKS